MYSEMLNLIRQLLPNGRAFWMPSGGIWENVQTVFAKYMQEAKDAMKSVLYSILPDTSNFTEADCEIWERRLGIYSSSAVPLADRRKAISRKLNHPGANPRQAAVYLESQLRAAGFDVHVYENRFSDGAGGYITKTPFEATGVTPSGSAYHSSSLLHGTMNHGGLNYDKIANYIEQNKDANFQVTELRSTFFIAGNTISQYATVQAERRQEFRQLILTLKPQHMVGFLFVNYT